MEGELIVNSPHQSLQPIGGDLDAEKLSARMTVNMPSLIKIWPRAVTAPTPTRPPADPISALAGCPSGARYSDTAAAKAARWAEHVSHGHIIRRFLNVKMPVWWPSCHSGLMP